MRINEILDENIDNVNGWGAVPYNQEVDYLGLRVLMRPSVFSKLAATLSEPSSSKDIAAHIKDGGAIGAPFLVIDVPPDDEPDQTATVKGHEGRNRMVAVYQVYGDQPIEVHIFPRGGLRRRHLTDDIIKNLIQGMYKEKSNGVLVNGPLFKVIAA